LHPAIINTLSLLLVASFTVAQDYQGGEGTTKTTPMYRPIEFQSEGATLRGRLYLPEKSTGKLPIVIMAHGYCATIEGMVADRYAEVFREAGFAVLLYDHRSMGISDGEPRQQISRWTQARGYRDAIDYVNTLDEVDTSRIGLWGDSMSGDEVIVVAAIDPRVKAVVAQVPACGRELPPPDPDGSLFEAIREIFLHGNVEATPENTIGPMPIVSFDQHTIPSLLKPLTAYRWFIEFGCRYNTGWENNGTYINPDVPARFTAATCSPHIHAALLMMVSHKDEMPGANTKVARHTFDIAPEPKKLIMIDGGHFGIVYYPSTLFDMASKAQANFLREYLQ